MVKLSCLHLFMLPLHDNRNICIWWKRKLIVSLSHHSYQSGLHLWVDQASVDRIGSITRNAQHFHFSAMTASKLRTSSSIVLAFNSIWKMFEWTSGNEVCCCGIADTDFIAWTKRQKGTSMIQHKKILIYLQKHLTLVAKVGS